MAKYDHETVSVACVNFHPAWGDKAANLAKMKTFVTDAAKQGNNIIVFPELALSGYECSEDAGGEKKPCRMHTDLAEAIPGPSTNEMSALAKKLDVYVIFGLPEQDKKNSATHEGPLYQRPRIHRILSARPEITGEVCTPLSDISENNAYL